jgi:hypothetical protein
MDVKIIEIDYGAYFPILMHRKEPLGPAAATMAWAERRLETWGMIYHSDITKNFFSQTKDPILDKLIDKNERVRTLEEHIKTDRECFERAREMFYKSGIASTSISFVSNKNVPEWNMGKTIDTFRFEFVGAKK